MLTCPSPALVSSRTESAGRHRPERQLAVSVHPGERLDQSDEADHRLASREVEEGEPRSGVPLLVIDLVVLGDRGAQGDTCQKPVTAPSFGSATRDIGQSIAQVRSGRPIRGIDKVEYCEYTIL